MISSTASLPAPTTTSFIRIHACASGARLELSNGSVLECLRRKGNQHTLREIDDTTPLDDDQLSHFLGDVDRDLFHVMFGIDHERLRKGGEEIVRGGGRVGELLFAAGAGLADLQDIQQGLQAEIDQLFKPTGRKGSIVDAIRDYDDARLAVKNAQVTVDTWRHHDENLQHAEIQKEKLDASIRTLRSEQNRLARIRDALPAIARWKNATAELAGFRQTPIMPDGFANTSHSALIELRKSEQQKRDAEGDLAQLAAQLSVTAVPTNLLAEADAIEALRDRLGGYRKAMADRPKLETSREIAEGEAKEILRKLDREPDLERIEELRLPTDKTVRIQNLGTRKEALVERLQSARRDCERLRRAIQRSETTLNDTHVPEAADALRQTTGRIQLESDLESQLTKSVVELEDLEREAALRIQKLPLWDGTIEQIELLAVPAAETLDRFDQEFNNAKAVLESLRGRVADETAAVQDLKQNLKQLELEQSVPTQEELAERRSVRNQGWQLVLQAWQEGVGPNQETAEFVGRFPPLQSLVDAYERSVQDADLVADRLRHDADRVATKAKLQADHEKRTVRSQSLRQQIAHATAELDDLQDQWSVQWSPADVTATSPTEMRSWLRQQQDIVRVAERIRTVRLEADRMRTRVDAMRRELSAALLDAGAKVSDHDPLHRLLQQASQCCEEIGQAINRRNQLLSSLDTDREDLEEATLRFAQAEQELSQWHTDWSAEMSRLGLEGNAIPSQANRVLTDINELFQKYQQADQYRTRLDGIAREAQDFQSDVSDLLSRLAPDLAEQPTEIVVPLLAKRLQEARSVQQRQDTLEQQKSALEKKRREANAAISNVQAQLDEMCRLAACQQYEQLSEAAIRSHRRLELENLVRSLEEQLITLAGGAELTAFVAEADSESHDVDSLAPRIEGLDQDIERTNAERDEILRAIEREEAELRRIDGSAVAAEKAVACEGIAASLEEQVERLAVLRAASAMLHAAIERHREKNQGPVLGRASQLFSQITRGAFQKLKADFDERVHPILTGVRGDGTGAVDVAGMSDGTCDQLYLALRLASLETWLQHHEPIPFVVDDVLLTFDDQRAIATLHALAEMSSRTQVIFFTHHRHLVDIARENLAGDLLYVHELETGTPDLQGVHVAPE